MPKIQLTRVVHHLDAAEMEIVIDVTPRGASNAKLCRVIDVNLRERFAGAILRTDVRTSRVRAWVPLTLEALQIVSGLKGSPDVPGQLTMFETIGDASGGPPRSRLSPG
jgi:hypothetical protein